MECRSQIYGMKLQLQLVVLCAFNSLGMCCSIDASDQGNDIDFNVNAILYRSLCAKNNTNTIKELYLRNTNLIQIPEEILALFPQLEKLDLSGNAIKPITANHFRKSPSLVSLDLSKNLISDVAAGS